MQYQSAYTEALQAFAATDAQKMAGSAGARLDGDKLELSYCGRTCRVFYPGGPVTVPEWPNLSHEEQIIILQYLQGASGLPQRGTWLSFLELPGGAHHFAPFQREAIFPLARHFGHRTEQFAQAASALGGKPAAMGSSGAIIPVFPRLSLAFLLWAGDEEFPATANILFDAVSETYLTTASLYMLGIAVARRLISYPRLPEEDWYEAPGGPGSTK